MLANRTRLLVLAAVVVALGSGLAVWLVGRGESRPRPRTDPVVFLKGVVRDVAANRYEHAWHTLHPAQQLVATKDAYVRCEQLTPIPGHLASINAVHVFAEPVAVAGGTKDPVPSTAVTFRLKLASAAQGTSLTLKHTVHAVAVKGRWAWIMPPKRFKLYSSKTCF